MFLSSLLDVGISTFDTALPVAIVVLALFLSYSMLNVCDLSTDGCYMLGSAVGAVIAIAGHPFLSIPAAMLAGMISGFVVAFLQTRMGINSLLAGIIVNTGMYSICLAIMVKPQLSMIGSDTLYSMLNNILSGTVFEGKAFIIVPAVFVILIVIFLSLFLKTRLGLAIRATGNNPAMVSSSSINPIVMTTIGLVISNSFTALAGCLWAQRAMANIDDGSGMVTQALAALLIGNAILGRKSIPLRAIGCVLGAYIFCFISSAALTYFDISASMFKLVTAIMITVAIALPYLKKQFPTTLKKIKYRKSGGAK